MISKYKHIAILVIFILSVFTRISAQLIIKGNVSNTQKEPLIGANVVIKGTTKGTLTDYDGNYSINVSDSNSILVFSYVGHLNQELSAPGNGILNVVLDLDLKDIEEVVVIGYGTQKKVDLSGSVAVVKLDELETKPIVSAGEALKGRAAGVYVKSNSGQPGSDPSILIRGRSSISSSTDPLVVVDGVPGIRMSDINMNDVISISVLKDAASAAIYGSSGANGVILITTKRGSKGQSKISFNYSSSLQLPPKKMDILNGQQYLDIIRDIDNGVLTGILGDQYITSSMIDTNNLVNTDWQNESFRRGKINNYSLQFSGGQDLINHNVSISYLNHEGYLKPSEYERFTSRINLDFKFSERIKMSADLSLSRNTKRSVKTGELAWNGSVMLSALNTPPLLPIYDEINGGYFINPFQPNIDHPTASINGTYGKEYDTRSIGKYNLTLKILNGLEYRFDLMGRLNLSKTYNYRSRYHTATGRQSKGEASSKLSEGRNIDINHILSFNKSIMEHNLEMMGGFVTHNALSQNIEGTRRGFPTDSVPHVYIDNFTGVTYGGTESNSEYRKYSYVGRINYNYNSKYYLQVNLRADGSSRFGSENKWGVFPSSSIAWRIAEERFFDNLNSVNELRLRFSTGITGNDAFDNYLYYSQYQAGWNHGMFVESDQQAVGYAPNPERAPNPYLKWEESFEQTLGIDLALWENRVTYTFDIFNKNSYDLLYNANLPTHTGYKSGYINIGEVNVKGIEMQLTTHNVSNKNFKWSTTLNYSADRNKVVDLGNLGDQFRNNENNIVREGEPIDALYGYKISGIIQSTDELNRYNVTLSNGTILNYQNANTAPGDILFTNMNGFEKDKNGNLLLDINGNPYSLITPDDRVIIGNPSPDFHFGIDNVLTYKDLEVSFFIQGIYGNDIVSLTRREIERMDFYFNYSATTLNRWKYEGQETNIPRAVLGDPNGNVRPSTRWLEDGSFVRLKYLTIAYNIPDKFLRKLAVKGARFYVTGENLLTYTNYSLFDPEVATNGSFGTDLGGYPQPQTYVFGVKLDF